MRIGILSDTHGNQGTAAKALEILHQRSIRLILHCGDIDDAETVRLFSAIPTHYVFGNCDVDRKALRQTIKLMGATLQEPFGSLELEGCLLAWVHGDDARQLRDLEQSGAFDFLFYGHTHHAEQHRSGPTLVVNPGALHRARPKSFAVLDLKTRAVESVILD